MMIVKTRRVFFKKKRPKPATDVIVKIGCTIHMYEYIHMLYKRNCMCVYESVSAYILFHMLMMTARVYVATDTHSGEKEAISFDRMGFAFRLFFSQLYSIEMLVLKFIRIMVLKVVRR